GGPTLGLRSLAEEMAGVRRVGPPASVLEGAVGRRTPSSWISTRSSATSARDVSRMPIEARHSATARQRTGAIESTSRRHVVYDIVGCLQSASGTVFRSG